MTDGAWRQLGAARMGPLVQPRGRPPATLAGVYRHGATLVWSARSALYLTSGPESGPFSVYVAGLDPLLGRLRAGQWVHVGSQRILIPAAQLSIDLTAAGRWPRPADAPLAPWPLVRQRAREALLSLPAYASRSLALGALIAVLGRSQALCARGPLADRMVRGLEMLRDGTSAGCAGLVRAAAQHLLGLGNGLTPAGDDVLAGYLATMRLAGPAGRLDRRLQHDVRQAVLAGRLARTHAMSAALLWAAAQGAVSGALERVIRRLLAGQPTTQEELAPLLAVGHSSGLDGLAGAILLLGCAPVEQQARVETMAS